MHTRVTFLSGDVHCAAVGVFKTHVKDKKRGELSPGLDFRYMLNIVSSERPLYPPFYSFLDDASLHRCNR